MDDNQLSGLLFRLRSSDAQRAWTELLDAFAPLMLQAVRLLQRDEDDAGDCFLFVCEQLCVDGFRRLRRYRAGGPATFSTWLRAVVRNLCLDWRRRQFGRARAFDSVARLSPLDRQIFSAVIEQGLSSQQAFLSLSPKFPGLTVEAVEESEARVRASLGQRQRRALDARRVRARAAAAVVSIDEGEGSVFDVADSRPAPEAETLEAGRREAVARSVGRLPAADRLLLRMRYEQGLTLQQIARLSGMKDAQTADRRLRDIVARIRQEAGDW